MIDFDHRDENRDPDDLFSKFAHRELRKAMRSFAARFKMNDDSLILSIPSYPSNPSSPFDAQRAAREGFGGF